jgi:hypothetical protein
VKTLQRRKLFTVLPQQYFVVPLRLVYGFYDRRPLREIDLFAGRHTEFVGFDFHPGLALRGKCGTLCPSDVPAVHRTIGASRPALPTTPPAIGRHTVRHCNRRPALHCTALAHSTSLVFRIAAPLSSHSSQQLTAVGICSFPGLHRMEWERPHSQ